ncbi:hypothetical protein ELQ35_15650 [Peribacillus cavernae]|uniref:Uncharacterized protein n=1 Tax=Peribacillus cavernae TaxID=1674310 RepID=A0A433HGU9_9BACI|nr:hypothetical protein [Peribacillus cavernae]MDQ0221341.1 hypothetical protein [Peribacillus cavernae]RUQ27475.1 hypothetical protein ELQ35_15650 [Peribacillus cavernae]
MSQFKQDILNYGDDVKDLDYSAYEHLRMLHDRTQIENIVDKLDMNEKIMLVMYDLMLVEKAEEMAKHISKVYDFSLSDKNGIPIEQWWWHLDKVAEGKVKVNYNVSAEKVI